MRSRYQKLPGLILLLTVVALAIATVILQIVERRLVETAGEQLALAADDIAAKLDLLLSERYGDIQILAQADVFQRTDADAMTEYLHELQDAHPMYRWLGVTDAQGRMIGATDQASIGQNRDRSSWFQSVRAQGRIQVRDVSASEEVGGEAVVSFSAPIVGPRGEFRGAVTTQIGLSALEDALAQTIGPLRAQQGATGRIEYQFLARDGTVIVDSALREERTANLDQLGVPSAKLADSASPGYVQEEHLRRHVLVVTGYARTRGSGEFTGLSWRILVRRDQDDVLAPIEGLLWKLGAAVGLVFVPTLCFLLWTTVHLRREWFLVQAESARAATAESSLQVRTEKLQLLVEATRQLTAEPNLARLLQHLTEMARRLTGARYAALGVFDETGERLAQLVTDGMDEATRQAIGPAPTGLGLLGHLAKEEQALRLKDLTQHEASVGFPPNHPPMHSFLGVSIRAHGRTFGRLYLTEKETTGERDAEFTEIDEHVLTALAAQAGIAIENAMLLDEIRAAEAKYRLLLESTGEGIYGLDREGDCVFTNTVGAAQLGYRAGELLGKRFIELARPLRSDGSPIPGDQCPITRALQTGNVAQADDVLIARRDGSRFPAHYTVSPIRGNGTITGVVIVARDITEQKQAKETIRRSRDFYLKLFDEFPTLIWKSGLDAKCDYFNRSWLDFTGRPLAQELGDGWAAGVHPDDMAPCVSTYLEAFRARTPFEIEYRLRRHDGVYRSIVDVGRPFYDLDGSFAGYIGSCYDITDRKKAEETLRAQAKLLDTFFNSTLTCLVFLDRNFDFIRVNEAYARACRRDVSEFIGRNHFEFYPSDAQAIFEEVRRTKVPFTTVARPFVFPDHPEWGVTYWDWTLEPLLDTSGEVEYFVFALNDVTERKRAELAFKESSQRFQTLVEHAPVCIHEIDLQGRLLSMNAAGLGMMAATNEADIVGREYLVMVAPEDHERIGARLAGAYAGTASEFEFSGPGGPQTRRFASCFVPIKSEDGTVIKLMGITRDITEQQRAEAALRESENRFRSVFDATAVGTGITRVEDGRIVQVNRALCAMLGYSETELTGKTFLEITHPDDTERNLREVERLLSGEIQSFEIEKRYRHRLGHSVWGHVSVALTREADGTPRFFIAQVQDITIRKQAETALRESEDRFRQLADNIRQVFWMTTPNKNDMLYISRAYETIWGHTCQSLYASPGSWFEAIHPEDRDRVRHAALTKQERGEYDERYRIIRPDGSVRWIEDRAFPVRDRTGRVWRIAGVAEDITERNVLEEQLRQAQKMEAIGQLAGGIAHDFNNLMTVINGYSHMLLTKLPPEHPHYKNVKQIGQAGERAASLTNQLLAFSRRQILLPKVFALNTVVENMEKMLQRVIGEPIEIVTVLHPTLGMVKADPGQIEQVILNLVVNARDAMPQGGRLTIETANVQVDTSSAPSHRTLAPGSYVLLRVSDTGHGMDQDTRMHIFEPFFTTKEVGKGTGLGLSTVYGIVKQSQGTIVVDSAPGQGTTFTIYLPQVEPERNAAQPAAPSAQPASGSETILLVEDEEAVRTLVREALEEVGFHVLEARLGSDALLVSHRHQGPIHLLLTDVVMPEMNGWALADRLTSQHPTLKVLFMSGYADIAAMRQGAFDPDTQFLRKPFSPEALVRKVREVLDRPPSS